MDPSDQGSFKLPTAPTFICCEVKVDLEGFSDQPDLPRISDQYWTWGLNLSIRGSENPSDFWNRSDLIQNPSRFPWIFRPWRSMHLQESDRIHCGSRNCMPRGYSESNLRFSDFDPQMTRDWSGRILRFQNHGAACISGNLGTIRGSS